MTGGGKSTLLSKSSHQKFMATLQLKGLLSKNSENFNLTKSGFHSLVQCEKGQFSKIKVVLDFQEKRRFRNNYLKQEVLCSLCGVKRCHNNCFIDMSMSMSVFQGHFLN